MGRPISPAKIGAFDGSSIRVMGVLNSGTGIEACYIVKQRNQGTFACSSSDGSRSGDLVLQQATPTAVGQGRITVTPFGATSATATATMKVVGNSVPTPGSAYVVGDTLTVAGGTAATAATFHVATINGTGGVLTVTPVAAGSYTALPTLTGNVVTGGTGTGAHITLVFGVNTIVVASGGTNYDVAPAVTITGAGGTGAAAHSVLSGSAVGSIVVDTAGSGFTAVATIAIAGASEAASTVEQHVVKTFEGHIYTYILGVNPTAAGQAKIDVQ